MGNNEWGIVYYVSHLSGFVTDANRIIWAASSEFGTYRLCEQRRFRRACASAQSRQNLRCSLKQTVSQEEPSDRKPDPWPLWMAGHAQLKFVMTECSKTQIRLTRSIYTDEKTMIKARCNRIRILSKTSNGEYIQTPRTTISHHNTNNAKMARGQLFPADDHHDPKHEHCGITLRTNKKMDTRWQW